MHYTPSNHVYISSGMPKKTTKGPFSAFSNKQKKQQLQEKRKRKQDAPNKFGWDDEPKVAQQTAAEQQGPPLEGSEKRLNAQPEGSAHTRVNKYSLVFGAETREELDETRRQSKEPLPAQTCPNLLTATVEDYALEEEALGMPTRGSWSYSMGKEKLELAEQKAFKEWAALVDEHYANLGVASYYERNLETWRQLWRTLEMSDIILFVCDIRYPPLHFSLAVYKYISSGLGKQVILVLNKIDMVHPSVSVSWKQYFEDKYPDMRVVLFSAFPEQQKLVENSSKGLLKKNTIRKPGWAYGADSLIQLAKSHFEDNKDKVGAGREVQEVGAGRDVKQEEGEGEAAQEYITIGMIGQPNAGKSSLINGLLKEKKVSVSRTPGHTKHFQTIFYSPDIRLCDCPGLVFPTRAPKQLQIVSGMYPVAQVREPYSVVGYCAQRINLVSLLRITHPCYEDDPNMPWSAWYICFAWAEKNGYHTARTGQPDVYRGANAILRLVVTGRLCVRLIPPNCDPDLLVGSYSDLLQELTSFADKPVSDEEEEISYQSEEGSTSDSEETNSQSCNKFSLLMGQD